jgi:hypothetical protein
LIRFPYGLLVWSVLTPGLVTSQSQAQAQTHAAPPAPAQRPAAGSQVATVPAAPKFPALAPPDSSYRLPVGETLVYTAQWRVFPAGVVALRMEQAGKEIRVVGSADASGAVGLLYHVHDRYESFLDPATFCSRNTSRTVEEGFRRVRTNITFDYQRGKSSLEHKNLVKNETRVAENVIPGCVTDVLSAIYYAGALPLQPGKTYWFPVNDGGKTVTVELRVEAREQIKTPAGTFNAIRVQPDAPSEVFKDRPKIWVWYSDDAARRPVQIRARMSWGMMTFMLQRVDKK